MAQKFLSDIHPTAGLKDSSGDLGTSGQVLSSTGSGTNWVQAGSGATVIHDDQFTATANQTAFTLSNTVDAENKTQVYIDGAYQAKAGYTVSGTTLTFDTGLDVGSKVEVITFATAIASNATAVIKLDEFVPGDAISGTSGQNFTLSQIVSDEKVTQVYINGVYQHKDTYSISGTTLQFSSAPPSGSDIEVITFDTIVSADGTLSATTFFGDLNGTINTATTATTQSAGNNSTKISTTAYADAKVADAINNGTTAIAPSQNAVFDALALKANIAGPTFTGTPAAPTASAGTNTTQLATTAFVTTGIANIVDSAPGTLNTLNELAAALGDDVNFSTTVTDSIATKLPLAGGTLTGKLSVSQSGADMIDLTRSSVGTYRLAISSSDAFSIFDVGANADRLTISSTGAATFSGKVKVSDGGNATTPSFRIGSDTNGISTPSTNQLNFITNSLTRLAISSGGLATFSGIVGINGSTTANIPLTATTSSGYEDVAYFKSAGTNIKARINLIPTGTGDGVVNATANDLVLQTSGTDRLTISSGGLVGIGTSTLSSSSRLTLLESTGNGQTLEIIGANSGASGSQPGIRFTGSSGQNIGGIYADTSSDNVRIQTGGTARLTIPSGGGLIISGSNNTAASLQLTNTSSSSTWFINTQYDNGDLRFLNGSVDAMRISSGGVVIVGSQPVPSWISNRDIIQLGDRGNINAINSSGNIYLNNNIYVLANGNNASVKAGGASQVRLADNEILFYTSNVASAANEVITLSNRLTINSGGNTILASGQSLFTQGAGRVYTHNVTLREQDNTAKFQIYSSGGGCVFYNSESNGAYYFYTNGSNRMRIASNGNVAVGDHTPVAQIDAGDLSGTNQYNRTYNGIKAGRMQYSWYIGRNIAINGGYTHILTDLWMGGSPRGNDMYIMGGFTAKSYKYDSNGYGEGSCMFHNWGGIFNNLTVQNRGNWSTFMQSPYTSTGTNAGYCVLVLQHDYYSSPIIDFQQSSTHYPWREVKVISQSHSTGTSPVY